MHPSLKQALDIINSERNATEYTLAFNAVHDLVSVFGELDLANRLFAQIPRTVPEERVADLFNLLAWQTNDNGAAMTREVETWLREQHDPRKLRIAMSLEVYPFVDAQEMHQVLTTLAVAVPEQTLMASRRAGTQSQI